VSPSPGSGFSVSVSPPLPPLVVLLPLPLVLPPPLFWLCWGLLSCVGIQLVSISSLGSVSPDGEHECRGDQHRE
jgi:hypothetical protein